MIKKEQITPEVIQQIMDIVNKGNACELKKEKENLVLVEIQRRVRSKTSPIGVQEWSQKGL